MASFGSLNPRGAHTVTSLEVQYIGLTRSLQPGEQKQPSVFLPEKQASDTIENPSPPPHFIVQPADDIASFDCRGLGANDALGKLVVAAQPRFEEIQSPQRRRRMGAAEMQQAWIDRLEISYDVEVRELILRQYVARCAE